MTAMELLILLIVSAVCGSIGMAIAGFSRGGCLTAIALGFVGALIGIEPVVGRLLGDRIEALDRLDPRQQIAGNQTES